jgi:putative ABC transport system permease protein
VRPIAASRGVRSLLVGVTPLDPVTYGAVIILVMVVVAVAALLPARRGARIDPLRLLRLE